MRLIILLDLLTLMEGKEKDGLNQLLMDKHLGLMTKMFIRYKMQKIKKYTGVTEYQDALTITGTSNGQQNYQYTLDASGVANRL